MVTTEVDIDPMLLGLDDVSVMETDLAEFIYKWMTGMSHILFSQVFIKSRTDSSGFAKN